MFLQKTYNFFVLRTTLFPVARYLLHIMVQRKTGRKSKPRAVLQFECRTEKAHNSADTQLSIFRFQSRSKLQT